MIHVHKSEVDSKVLTYYYYKQKQKISLYQLISHGTCGDEASHTISARYNVNVCMYAYTCLLKYNTVSKYVYIYYYIILFLIIIMLYYIILY